MAWHSPLSKKFQTRRPNKYGAEKVTAGGRTYDSKSEYEMHGFLTLLERAGEISNIRHHPAPLKITPHVSWKVDFIVFDEKLKQDVAVEFKGLETERYRIIRQLLFDFAPMLVRIYKKQNNRIFLYESFDKK